MMYTYKTDESNYCYKGTNILINKAGLKTKEALEKLEKDIVTYRLFELMQSGITGEFDKHHLISIHKKLFGDIYDFAGKYRNENIAKGSFLFSNFEFIDYSLDEIFKDLAEDIKTNAFEKQNKEEIAKKLAYYYAEINVVHPFREGNGRATREFLRQLALKYGYILDFTKIPAKDILVASIKSITDITELTEIYKKGLRKA